MSGKITQGVFLVGGAVRDGLLGRAVSDRDWVVVGKTPEDMLAAGYTQVGRDFPVFLHPETHEEYALARTERKTAAGHQGFECYAGLDVTLEDDLLRRDLTVNALAQTPEGDLIDPYGGEADLRAGVLRHVSPAFAEDPLRILRVARFAAQLGFSVAPETLTLMQRMAAADVLAELPAERVWQETHKALGRVAAPRFVEVLAAVNALTPWFTEWGALFASPSVLRWDAPGEGALQRWGSLGLVLGGPAAAALAERLKVPKRFARFAQAAASVSEPLQNWSSAQPQNLLHALRVAGALQMDARERRDDFLALLELLTTISGEFDAAALARLAAAVAVIGADSVQQAAARDGSVAPTGKALGEAITAARCAYVESAQAQVGGPQSERF